MSINADSTIIAVAVSAITSVAILMVSSYLIQPRRIKKSWAVEHLEKRLAAYGALIVILDSMNAKALGHPLKDIDFMEKNSFYMEVPYDYERLFSIMQNKSYLFSKEILELWFKRLQHDAYYDFSSSPSKADHITYADLRELQETTKTEYLNLKAGYEEMTSIKLAN